MRYHAHCIKSINDVIRDLWHKTYKGNDITSIEIKADATANARSVSNFQYSVVMKKGHAEVDMRLRCSAGQKVRCICECECKCVCVCVCARARAHPARRATPRHMW